MGARSVVIGFVLAGGVVSAVAQTTLPNTQIPGVPPPQPLQVPRSGAPPVVIPGHGPKDSFSDRVTRCIHYGTAAGVPPGEIGAFSRRCADGN